MQLPLKPSGALPFDPITPRELTALLAEANALQAAAGAGKLDALLRGKNFGLLCESMEDADVAFFRLAAVELGAHVACIRTRLSELSTPQEVQRTARMLGRLYDGVECQGMTPALIRQVRAEAGVPVYDGIASQDHPTARLADSLSGTASPADRRRLVLQAVLLNTTT
ncbi:ornithine carbamoyltransferase [Piscinibacter koreensis]|uniref:Ornithine carbamoyltransferase n=1 Tax=Piscinibacter koreensis TaxID=2742824 RepID=A0A7Y6NSF7_9BURK|nr:ornithine carbamoyltransferase [Schlegelella koreensis]NUZ08506.1 ornithine carbamoyltransferase [Schlegelella koreensis]